MRMSFRNEPSSVKCGTGVLFKNGSTTYILAQIDCNRVALIALDKYANRWTDPVQVKDSSHLSAKEWENVIDGGEFELIGIIDECNISN